MKCNINVRCCSERKNVNLLVSVYGISHGKVPCVLGLTGSILSERTTNILWVKSHKSADLIYTTAGASNHARVWKLRTPCEVLFQVVILKV